MHRNDAEERIFNTGNIAQEGKKKNRRKLRSFSVVGVKWKDVVVVKNQKEWLRMKRLTHVSGWKELEKIRRSSLRIKK